MEEVERVQENSTHLRNFLRTFEAEGRGRILADGLEESPTTRANGGQLVK